MRSRPAPALPDAVDSDAWCTDGELARMLGHFSTDVASNPRSLIQADQHLMLESGDDGLLALWGWSVYCNPPYSDPLPWAIRLAAHAGPWVALVKSDPTTRWYATLKHASTADAPFRHRLKFGRPDKPPLGADFPSHLFWHWWQPSPELTAQLWLPTYAPYITPQPTTDERT